MSDQNPTGLPGARAALKPGSLSRPFFGPQGDEHREPPANAPSPVTPAPTISPIADQAQGEQDIMEKSTRTTGGDPVEGLDPGGTRPAPSKAQPATEHHVESGDRNNKTSSTVAPVNKAK